MECRKFNSVMPRVNHLWSANTLQMKVNEGKGPDLLDKKKDVELKFCLVPPAKGRIGWTAFDYQLDYNNGKPCFWGLGIYQLDRPVDDIRTINPIILEEYVRNRELYIVSQEWMRLFPPHEVEGKTRLSKWKYTFRYPQFSLLPEIKRTIQVNRGLVHLTKEVPEELFKL